MSSIETAGNGKRAGTGTAHPGERGVRVTVNGEAHAFEKPIAVRELLDRLSIAGRVAVAVDREVIPRADYARRTVRDGDRVEILEAVGGG